MSKIVNKLFTTSGTFAVPAGIKELTIFGRGADTANTDLVGFPTSLTPGTSYTVTISSSLSRVLDGSTIIVTFPNGSGATVNGEVIIQWID